jgi:hypothetical protein
MIETNPGHNFEAILIGAPHGLVGTLTFSVINPATSEVLITARSTGITEPVNGTYRTTATAPFATGEYVVVWTNGIDTATEGLTVLPSPAIRPTAAQVALLLRTRTVGPAVSGLGGDTGLGDRTSFDATTRPSLAEVEAIIDVAVGAIQGRLVGTPPASLYGAVSHTVALYATLLVELSFFREQADEQATRILEDVINASVLGLNGRLDDLPSGGGSEGPVPTFGMIKVASDRDHTTHPRPDSILDSDWEQSLLDAGVFSWR